MGAMHENKLEYIITSSLAAVTLITGAFLASTKVAADDSVVDDINITVPISCTLSGTGNTSHNAEINNGTYVEDIGATTLKAFCNDNEGFAIYANGYTNSEDGNNVLINSALQNDNTIATGLATSGDTSNWAMKLVKKGDTGDTTNYPLTIDSAPNATGGADATFAEYHVVPTEFTKVAHKGSGTDMAAPTGGATLETTYAAYVNQTQSAGDYAGKVKYVLVHPSNMVAGKLNVVYDANGLNFTGNKTTNLVAYNATAETMTGEITKISRAQYSEEGAYTTYGPPAGNDVVTIDGADSLHIEVTYGVPQNNGGPPSDLFIWAGDHSDYTNSNNDTSLTSCGATEATNGAFSSNGSSGSQTTMECDIAGDSVTFYDYGQYGVSTGYYAVVTGQGDITAYDKTVTSGTYTTPTVRSGQDVFLGWSTNPNANAEAEDPMYTNEAEIIAKAPYTNDDTQITLYAVWGKTFNAAYADAGMVQTAGHYKMTDATEGMCKKIYVGATETLVDTRDNNTYTAGRLKDGNCWMLDNLALDPTDSTTAANMNEENTNASAAAISNLLNGGSSTAGWSSTAVANVTTNFSNNDSYVQPRINNASKDTVVTSYGVGSGKVGIYYNYCAASASTYCYAGGSGVDKPDTIRDADQDICPANWRMPTGGSSGEYLALAQKYGSNATDTTSLQYVLSTPLSGNYYYSSASSQGGYGTWWSSTYFNSDSMYRLYVDPTRVYPTSSGSRFVGDSMRCLVGE